MRRMLPLLLAGLLAACGSVIADTQALNGTATPPDAPARLRQAEMLANAGRWREAADAYAGAIRMDGTLRAAWLGLGRARLRGGDLEGGERGFRDAIAALPRDPGAQSGLGVALDLQGRHAEAQVAYRAALALDPSHVGARTNLALSLTLSGHGAEAVQMIETVARAPEATPRQRHNLALAYAASGDAPRAAELLAPELGEESREAVTAWRAALGGS